MIVQCPHCAARFNVDDKVIPAGGRNLRCSRCRLNFFMQKSSSGAVGQPSEGVRPEAAVPEVVPAPSHPHPTPPHPGEDVPPERRKQERLFLHAKAELRLKKGLIYHGRTRELDETGVIFLPERPITGVTIGDRGIFSFILEGGAREFFTEFPCEITKLVEETIYIHFYQSAGNRPGTMRPGELRKGDLDLVKPGSTVCVYRQGGKVEGGWVVLEPDVKLPPNIQSSYEAKEIEGSCVVCRKKSPTKDGQDMYKVYFILDLMAIQIQVTKDAVDQNKAANQNTNN